MLSLMHVLPLCTVAASVLSLLLSCTAPAPTETKAPSQAKPTLVTGQVPVAPFVAKLEQANPKRVLVYVGAAWCEPCRHFHDALVAGRLDALLGDRQVIEYDLDQHKEALVAAGYTSRLIPLFALPNRDGTASVHSMSGSIKGERAVAENLVPRLSTLLRQELGP